MMTTTSLSTPAQVCAARIPAANLTRNRNRRLGLRRIGEILPMVLADYLEPQQRTASTSRSDPARPR